MLESSFVGLYNSKYYIFNKHIYNNKNNIYICKQCRLWFCSWYEKHIQLQVGR